MRRSLLRGFTRRFAEAPGRWRAIWLITEEPASTMPRLIAARLLQTVLRAPGQICITVSSQRAYREALTEDLLQSGLCLATLSDCNFRERSVYPPGKTVGWSAHEGEGWGRGDLIAYCSPRCSYLSDSVAVIPAAAND